MAHETFLSEFPPVSAEQWEHSIRETIRGEEYASKLIWHPEEGLVVRPYYRAEDLAGLEFLDAAPGDFPFVRGASSAADWRLREEIDVADPEEANHAACAAVAAGAEEIAFQHTRLESLPDLAILLAGLDEIPIYFNGLNPQTVLILMEQLRNRKHEADVSSDLDPLDDLDFSADLIRNLLPGFRPFVVHADEFQEHAAGALEEVAFAISAGVDFVAEMQERGLSVDRITESVSFSFAMGPEFFIQIAKLRAFRLVWAKAVESFGGSPDTARASIHALTPHWNETVYDPEVNILRVTAEVISAILGGADSISAAPFDRCFRKPDESSLRLARNTQIILKQEALLSRVADPLGGSYLIEVLTNSIASKAWKLFQELEAAGGYRNASAAGVLASVLDRRVSSREESVACRRRVLAGTNCFADASENALGRVNAQRLDCCFPRAAQAFEELRLRTKQFTNLVGKQPRIVLAEIGEAKMRSARSEFAADFLACAGLVTDKRQFESAEQIAGCVAELVVLCSSDAEYLPVAAKLIPILKKQTNPAKVIIAGNPETAEELGDIGVVDFIHLRSNAVEVLARLQRLIRLKD